MSNYASIENEIIINIIVCDDSKISELSGSHVKITDERGTAQIGGYYDSEKDKFIKVKPYPSWILNEDNEWVSPTGQGDTAGQTWNEEEQEWIVLEVGPAPE
jgi:glutamate synthase domain-containing protein 3